MERINYDHWTLQRLTERVRRLLEESTTDAAAVESGARWYQDANDIAADMSAGSGLSPLQCAGVISAFSIRTPWKRNVDNALYWMSGDHERVKAMALHTDKARAVCELSGAAAECSATVRAVLRGDKVASFADNINAPERSALVTLDSHMARAAGLERYADLRLRVPLETPAPRTGRVQTETLYARLSHAFRIVANEYDVPVPEAQARVWCHVRGAAD